jgi:hypothetical protein
VLENDRKLVDDLIAFDQLINREEEVRKRHKQRELKIALDNLKLKSPAIGDDSSRLPLKQSLSNKKTVKVLEKNTKGRAGSPGTRPDWFC